MIIPYKGGCQVPGPIGVSPARIGGRIPGPLRFGQIVLAGAPVAAKVVKTLKMPAPADRSDISTVHEVTSPLFKGKGQPTEAEILQGDLSTCPIGSILAALVHTERGLQRIKSIVAEHPSVVETDITGVKLESPPANKKVPSKRYFTVKLGGTGYEVSDVFYTDDGDHGTYSLIYMGASQGSPPTTLWPSVIEKAYAVRLKNYQELDNEKHTANEFWEGIVGSKPEGFAVDDKTDLEQIRKAAKAAVKVPTIGASRGNATKVVKDHAFAILGIEGSTIRLYNPWGDTEKISLEDFRRNFQAILYGNP